MKRFQMHQAAFMFGVVLVLPTACGAGQKSAQSPATAMATTTVVPLPPDNAEPPRPDVGPPAAYVPPSPSIVELDSGARVLLVARHELPLVSITCAIPFGAASDPARKEGLASVVATMLNEGAGERNSVEFSEAIEILGAELSTSVSHDASFVSLTVLKRNLPAALSLLADLISRPRFDHRDWKRVHELWVNELRERPSDPAAVMQVVTRAAYYGESHPYGHPVDGRLASAKRVTRKDVVRFYRDRWRLENLSVAVSGDVTPDEVKSLFGNNFPGWKASGPVRLQAIPPSEVHPNLRIAFVDRRGAPQSFIAVVRPSVAVSNSDWPLIGRANIALGGSFTSRLNQDLREEHGWTYGARSSVSATRGEGTVSASAAVHTEKTGVALHAMLDDISAFAKQGLTDEEVTKTRSQSRSETVQAYESLASIAKRLANNAALGLAPDFDTQASRARESATKEQLNALVANAFDPKGAIIIVVGPQTEVQPQLDAEKIAPTEMWDAEGHRIAR